MILARPHLELRGDFYYLINFYTPSLNLRYIRTPYGMDESLIRG